MHTFSTVSERQESDSAPPTPRAGKSAILAAFESNPLRGPPVSQMSECILSRGLPLPAASFFHTWRINPPGLLLGNWHQEPESAHQAFSSPPGAPLGGNDKQPKERLCLIQGCQVFRGNHPILCGGDPGSWQRILGPAPGHRVLMECGTQPRPASAFPGVPPGTPAPSHNALPCHFMLQRGTCPPPADSHSGSTVLPWS